MKVLHDDTTTSCLLEGKFMPETVVVGKRAGIIMVPGGATAFNGFIVTVGIRPPFEATNPPPPLGWGATPGLLPSFVDIVRSLSRFIAIRNQGNRPC